MNAPFPGWATAIQTELFSIPLAADRYIVYAPLRRTAFVANAALVNAIADLTSGDGVADASVIEFLHRMGLAGTGDDIRPGSNFEGEPEPTAVTLFLTTRCNLRCTYCYASAGDTPERSMSLDVARQGIEFVARNAKRRGLPSFEVAYHGGGEPSVNWRVMTESLAYARQLGAELGLGVTAAAASNGMLSETQVEWMIRELQGVSVSFDGLPATQDKHRITIDGRGSSQRVEQTLRRFDAAGFKYGIRVTVTRDQISALATGVDYMCELFRPQRIQVEPSYQLGRWSEAPTAETQEFIAAYREAQALARARGREISYSAARLDTLTNHFCGITQDTFALSPDGNASACYEVFSEAAEWAPVFFYGKSVAGTGYQFDRERLAALRAQTVEHKAYCQGCFAKWHCAGDCHHKTLHVNGTGEFQGSDRCHVTRELVKDQLAQRIANHGGMVWREALAVPGRPAPRPGGNEVSR
jgi:uncharacterized protein